MAKKKFFVSSEELRKAYSELKSAEKVSIHFGVSKKLILNYMKRFGINRKQRGNPAEQALTIAVLSKRGFSSTEIGSVLGICSTLVNRIARQYNIRIRDYYHPGYAKGNGYVLIMKPGHPHADSKGYVREHRLIVEKKLGTILDRNTLVHHSDGIKTNNNPDNLSPITKADHVSLHHTGKDGRKRKDLIAKQRSALVPVSPCL